MSKLMSKLRPVAAPDPSSPVARLQQAAKRAKDEGDTMQAQKFAEAARDLACGDDSKRFEGVLRRLATPKA